MFTSRSEYRMTLRSDNADLRLTEKGRAAGSVGDSRWARFQSTRSELARVTELLQSCVLSPEVSCNVCLSGVKHQSSSSQKWQNFGIFRKRDGQLRR